MHYIQTMGVVHVIRTGYLATSFEEATSNLTPQQPMQILLA